jgi:glycosyltransferase involved in cell wall biosynthesis
MSPKVTVIIPAYNAEDTIEQAIKSIPDRDDIEVIFVNDGSTDKTADVAFNAIVERDGKCTLLSKSNGGMASAVNAGLAEATGEYVVLLDADDDFYTDKFIEAMRYLDGTDLVYFDLQINSGAIWHLSPETKEKICGEVKFMRREFIQGIRWDESIRAAEDYYYYQELLKKNPTENFTGIVAKHYNYPREGSLSWQLQNGIIKN